MDYKEWLPKARDILLQPNSPLKLKNGVWSVTQKEELLSLIGANLLDHDIDSFRTIAESVLNELDPAFELSKDERYVASIHGKVLKHSGVLRQGISEGLALLGNNPKLFSNCSLGKTEKAAQFLVKAILQNATWQQWASLNNLISNLAEAAPNVFLSQVNEALLSENSPFEELFAQESSGISGGNYLTGLLWAMESLAWDPQYLVRVCTTLAELATYDPGGNWINRPANSLVTILLPWLPQTLAPIDKRFITVKTIIEDTPEVGWKLLLSLLPGQHQTSSGTHKPKWRKTIPEEWNNIVTRKEFREQSEYYSGLAVETAGIDFEKVLELIDYFDHLPKPAFDKFINNLSSEQITTLPEDNKQIIWDRLSKLLTKHRKFPDAEWVMSEEYLLCIEGVTKTLAPKNPFNLYQHLFSDRDFDLYTGNGNWDEQRKKLDERRNIAIKELLSKNGLDGIIEFAERVLSPREVGNSLGLIGDEHTDSILLPSFLTAEDFKRKAFISSYILRRHFTQGWHWADNLLKDDWNKEQLGVFIAYLPFEKNAWDRAESWLHEFESEYWTRTPANGYQSDSDLHLAIKKLMQYGRPRAAIDCLGKLNFDKKPIDNKQCIEALLSGVNSEEPQNPLDSYNIVELIKYLQTDNTVNPEDLFKVEWAYLSLLDGHHGATPIFLEHKLASEPYFFCELIQLIYRSKNDTKYQPEISEKHKLIAENAYKLFRNWKTPPGTGIDDHFSSEVFDEWVCKVKDICSETGHLEVAMITLGQVLIYSPIDEDGLWIHRTIANTLNCKQDKEIRDGFVMGVFNARGAHFVDPSGTPEKEFAEQFHFKAESVENAGYQHFAVTLREIAESYLKEAEKVRTEYENLDD